jgi:adenosylcobyric acid synthase
MSRALMVQGTCSGAGKSLLVAGLLRIFRDAGVKVAPFKAQNMALNSYITEDGCEIGRAHALQAEAAGVKPSADMNPILLKAVGEKGCQVIVNGRVHSNMTAKQYYAFKNEAWQAVTAAYERLSRQYELIIIEGAGSPAEINLMDDEIVNMKVARYTRSPVLLVGDIDRGGVFASFYGTVGLLNGDAEHIKGFVINKFRGDKDILLPGLHMIKEKTGIPVIGVIPYVRGIGLSEEDGLNLETFSARKPQHNAIRIVIVRLNYISNFTDFDPFFYEPDVEVVYSVNKSDIENADLLIIPGSKNTIKDLLFIRESGIEESIKRAAKKGVVVAGICGGYQMLGKTIKDPLAIEGDIKEAKGIGLLDIETEIKNTKVTSQVEAEPLCGGFKGLVRGYEIHMGVTKGEVGLFRLHRFSGNQTVADGSLNGNVWGTYIHGIFDNDEFRLWLLNSLREKKGLPVQNRPVEYSEIKEQKIERWAAFVRDNLDMEFIRRLLW